ncbi:hypothetical protein ACFLRN_06485 [Thermoproteota archaeon]
MKNISGWKKAIIMIAFFNVLVVFIDFVVLSFYGIQIKETLGWIFGSEDKTILSNFLFFEGALTIGIGALLAGGFAENKLTPTKSPSTHYSVEKLSKHRTEFRQEQISTGLLLMLAGLPLIVMSVLSFIT